MRSKAESVKPTQVQGAMPRLRFPGFKGDGCTKQLGQEGSVVPSVTDKNGAYFGLGNARYVPYMNVFANTFVNEAELRTVQVNQGELQTQVQKGDVLFTISSE